MECGGNCFVQNAQGRNDLTDVETNPPPIRYTHIYTKDGQLVHRVEGALPASELTKLVNQHCFGAAEA